jgi:hypothetical protein
VPDEVRGLFETARAVLIYAYLYYPLYMLGLERLGQVAEAALAHRARSVGCPMQVPVGKGRPQLRETSFGERIRWMSKNGYLTPTEATAWEAHRQWRNHGAHPDQQEIIPPSIAVPMLKRFTRDINALFAS